MIKTKDELLCIVRELQELGCSRVVIEEGDIKVAVDLPLQAPPPAMPEAEPDFEVRNTWRGMHPEDLAALGVE